ncbi:MAG: SDR family NAD(P)-dependent oxidoreductase, partial [Candidatus Limnocylindrus sp.]
MFELKGYAAIVTGGARGIGRAISLALADAGADVLITYKGNTAAADAVVAEISGKGRKAIAIQADAADPDAAATVVAKAIEAFGKVDLLVNNAGITRDTLILRMTPEQWREVIDTNLSGAFYMTKAAVKEMLRAKSGRIINITSVSGQAGNA